MSDKQRHGKMASTPRGSEETVDYTDFATEPAVRIDEETGNRVVQKPDGESVVIDYDAARRRPAPPPNFNLAGHYDPPTNVDGKAFDAYAGPDHFAPSAASAQGPSTIPLDLHAAQVAWDAMPSAQRVARSRAPVPPTGPAQEPADSVPRRMHSELSDDEVPTNQWTGKDLSEGIGTPPPASETTPPPNPRAVSGGLTGSNSAEMEVIEGIPARQPPPPAQAARAQTAPPAVALAAPPASQAAPQPSPQAEPPWQPYAAGPPLGAAALRKAAASAAGQPLQSRAPHNATARPALPMRRQSGPGGDDQIDTNVLDRFEEPSGVFVADEYEAAALRRSPWMYVGALAIVGTLAAIVLTIVVLAFAGGGAVKLEQLIREQISAPDRAPVAPQDTP